MKQRETNNQVEQAEPAGGQAVVKQIVCPECRQTFVPSDFTVRPVERYPTVRDVGISCPHCQWFGHLFVEDMPLRRRRTTLATRRKDWQRHKTPGKWRQVKKAKEDLGRVFDETQAKWRPLLGLTPIAETAPAAEVE